MAIPFTCPHCGATTDVAEEYAGETGPCARCGKTITVPPLAGRVAGTSGDASTLAHCYVEERMRSLTEEMEDRSPDTFVDDISLTLDSWEKLTPVIQTDRLLKGHD